MEPLRYVSREPDRHGNVRYYYRRFGRRIRLQGLPGCPEFTHSLGEAAATFEGVSVKRTRASPPRSFVYFVTFGNSKVKIGTCRNVQSRLSQLRTGIPGKGRVHYVTPGGRLLEQELHQLFAEYRVNGEWFHYSRAIRDWIETDRIARFGRKGNES